MRKNKRILVIALLFLLGISIAIGTSHLIYAQEAPQLAVVLDNNGTATTQSNISPLAVGSTFTVDIYISNTQDVPSPGINAISLQLNWDSSVLECTSMNDGNYLPKQSDLGDIGPYSSWLQFGLIVVDTSNPQEAAAVGSTGIIGSATFQVVDSGSCAISITPSGSGIPYLDYPVGGQSTAITGTTTVNAQYGSTTSTPSPTPTASSTPTPTPTTSPSPTPTATPASGTYGPTAVISIQNGTTYTIGSSIVLDGSLSTAGQDGQSVCPITNWGWIVQYENGTDFGAYSGSVVSFTTSYVGSLKVTLIVSAPDVASPASPQYTNTAATSIWINIQAVPTAKIDVFTNNGGIGVDVTNGPFGPQEMVYMYALVTYGGAPVVNLPVTFVVQDPNSVVISVTSSATNSTGYATAQYRTPWPSSGSPDFGNWSVTASVDVSQVVVSKTVSFEYNYLVTNNGITLPASVDRGSPITVTVNLGTTDQIALNSVLTITIYDQNQVPVVTYMKTLSSTNQATVSATMTIPTWAFVGTATVYVNVLTNSPTDGGVPYLPEQTATFQILS